MGQTMKKTGWLLVLAALALAACGKGAHQPHAEGLDVVSPWSRAIPPSAPVAAGFMTLRNHQAQDDRLLAVRSDAAERVEIHEVRHEDGMARMRELTDGLMLPAGETVELKPGGYHLMFIGPVEARFVAGGQVAATLVFEQAGEREVAFDVRPVDAGAPEPADAHSQH